jgi:acyl-CoA synthetase (AMP-forming)/AMP-acid ligase II/acyl carrier protein
MVACNGAEPVRSTTLDAFAAAFASCGFSRAALSPAYGLAEVTLMATMTPPGRAPRYLPVRSADLAGDRVVPAQEGENDTRTIVGCGGPVNTEVLIVNPETLVPCVAGQVGEIWLRGRSVARGYFGRPEESQATFAASPASGDGTKRYLRTGDLGFLHEGELFVTGRLKDLVIIRGRNHYPQDIELTVEGCHPAFRPLGTAAFSIDIEDEERLVIVQELDRHARDVDAADVAARVRQRVADEHELSPWALVLVKTNGIPKTSSGKIQRQACRQAFLQGSLPVVAEWREQRRSSATSEARENVHESDDRPTQEAIEDFVSQRLSSQLGVRPDDIDLRQPFTALGVDSARALTLLGEVEAWLGRPLSPTLFWNYPTISDLAAHLAQPIPEATLAEDARS